MGLFISTPSILSDPFKEVTLKYDTESILKSTAQSTIKTEKSIESVISGIVPTPPKIIFSRPLWWHLTSPIQQLTKKKGIAKEQMVKLHSLLRDNHFYLIFISCFFKPEIDCPITYARFSCNLRQSTGRKHPIALDIFPQKVDHLEENTIHRVTLNPNLTFSIYDDCSDSVCTIEVKNLIPHIKGNKENETNPFWDYFPYLDKYLIDYRFGYILVMKPKEAKSLFLTLNIYAEVKTPFGEFKAFMKEKDRQFIQMEICPEYLEFI